MIKIEQRDLITILTISLMYLLIASWNLGSKEIPTTTFQASGEKSVYIDLGNQKEVDELFIFIKSGEIKLDLLLGNPGDWDHLLSLTEKGYSSWEKIVISDNTRFIQFNFEGSNGAIAEIAVIKGNEKLKITSIQGENNTNKDFLSLFDEQEKVIIPPSYLTETYFDEIYFVRAAEEILSKIEPYESTHPPLGKIILATGIYLFGYNPFGWRIMGVIFATLMIPIIYYFGKLLTGSNFGALISSLLLALDFMHFTMGRIATVDTFLIFFSIISQLFFYIYYRNLTKQGWDTSTRPLFIAVIFFSLALSTKWIALFGFSAQIVLFLILLNRRFIPSRYKPLLESEMNKRRILFTISALFAVAAIVYLLSYTPYMALGHSLKDVYDKQWSMFSYHLGLTSDHPFSSPWWSWPIIIRPVWLHVSEMATGVTSTIVAMGNPAIWWVGLISMRVTIEKFIKERDLASMFIVFVFFLQWLPYAFISRPLFLYHYYLNVPIICLATASFVNSVWHSEKGKTMGILYLFIVGILFFLYYPVISGHPVSNSWVDLLKLFRSWIF
jgi:dolichyl-phosphate-mannose--protein O-mannosyl transferase